jgi:two-component system sensor histidine kinase KdpD
MTDPTDPPTGAPAQTGERLLVAVGPGPFSPRLIRLAHRLAGAGGMPWLAVNIEPPALQPPGEQKRLDENLALARELGAEVIVIPGRDPAELLVRVARQYNVSQIVVGRSGRRSLAAFLRGGTVADRIVRRSGAIAVHVVPTETRSESIRWLEWDARVLSPRREYITAAAVSAAVTAAGFLVRAWVDYWAIAPVYLFMVVLLGLRLGQGPILFAATLSALMWDYFFFPPVFSLAFAKFEDGLMFSMFFAIAIVTGRLVGRIRLQERAGRMREQRATSLYQLSRVLAAFHSADEVLRNATKQVQELWGARLAVLIADPEHPDRLPLHPAASYAVDEKEQDVARWALHHRQHAGRFTPERPEAEALYIPLVAGGRVLGVMGVKPPAGTALTLVHREMLDSFATQIALALEHDQLRVANEVARLRAASDRLQRTLLDGVSHELKTPLAIIGSAAESLAAQAAAPGRPLVQEIRTAVQRLQRLVNNLLDTTRLESGVLRPQLDWCDLSDLVNTTLRATAEATQGRTIRVHLPPGLPLVRFDFELLQQALANLIHNACQHTPPAAEIGLAAGVDEAAGRVWLEVTDGGPGLREEQRPHLFNKFVRGQPGRAGGLGLGLSIVKGFVEAHGGRVTAENRPGGGARFVVFLPLDVHGSVPAE